ncbi:MAG: FmdB family zinc ribbon protein [Candidatus Omnitrophota bacterium]
MPTYEYECNSCSHHFDVFQSMKAEHVKNCPKCNGSVRRLISPGAGFIFKGPGFYATDYKKSSRKKTGECGGSCCSSDCPKKNGE